MNRAYVLALAVCCGAWRVLGQPAAIAPPPRRTTGDYTVMFLRAEFPDHKMKEDLSYFSSPSTGRGLVDQMVAYYKEVSGGKLMIRPVVSQRVYMLNNIRPYYRGRAKELVEQTVAQANAPEPLGEGTKLDFSKADALVIFFAGTGVESDTNGDSPLYLWSHFFVAEPSVFEADGVMFTNAVVVAEHESNEQNPRIDFSPLDGQPARIVVLALTPLNAEATHVKFMSLISRALDHRGREQVLAATSKDELWNALTRSSRDAAG